MRLPRAESLLPIAIIASAGLLIASEFMVSFELVPAGGEPIEALTAADRHEYALVVVGALAIVATIVAMLSGSRAAAFAVAGAAGVAMLILLTLDVPDVGRTGTVEDPILVLPEAKSEPRIGFWLQAISTLGLAIAAATFATLSSEQLRRPLARFGIGGGSGGGEAAEGTEGDASYQR